MTTTMQKTETKVTWPVTKIQDEVSQAMMRNMALTFKVVEKAGPQVLQDWYHAFNQSKVEYFKKQGVKTPLDLVRVMAEFETNVFGSQIRFWGDEKEAHMEYLVCGAYQAMQKVGVTKEQMEHMGKNCASQQQEFAKEFGFTGDIKHNEHAKAGEPISVLTFVRK